MKPLSRRQGTPWPRAPMPPTMPRVFVSTTHPVGLLVLLAALAAAGCSGAQEPTTELPQGASSDGASETSAPPTESDTADAEAEAEAMALIEAEERALAKERGELESPPSDDPTAAPREVVYKVGSGGFTVEVDGATFKPTAEAVHIGEGWGVKLMVSASADSPKVLFEPATGPLAFGGRVKRSSGAIEQFGDRREGGHTMSFGPGNPASFSRTWPSADMAPLGAGDELELQVGLWGFGTEDDRRPLRRFAVIRMVASASGAQPVLQPPSQ